MRASELAAVEGRLEAFLGELIAFMGRKDRRAWAGAYVRGLLLDGERKSAEPMATRLGRSKQGLQQFVSQSPWPAAALLEGLVRREARRPAPAYWIIDETSFPKAGKHSVGVARQYCGALGKLANCQVAVSLHRAGERAGESRPLSWRLYLPEGWTEDVARRRAADVPAEVSYQSKTDLALAVLDEALGWGAPPGVVLADEAYGGSFEWRAALRERALRYAVRVPWTTTGWREAPRFEPPKLTAQGRPARRPRPLGPAPQDVREIARGLPPEAWTQVTWRQGSKGAQTNRFARLPVWAANGWRSGPQPERVGETLLVEWPADAPEPTRYWLARNCPWPSWWPRPKRAGASSRTTANSRGNSVSTTSRAAPGRAGATTSLWSRRPSPSCVPSSVGALPAPKKRPPPTLPAMRRLLQAVLIRWSGRCPWCRTPFEHPQST